MTLAIITALENDISALFTKAKESAVVQTVETDAKAIGESALTFIKTQGLADLYKIALAALAGAATGTPWATIGAAVVSQGEAAGITIAKGAESIVLAQAQADLIAAGSIIAPTSGEVVASLPAPAPVAEISPAEAPAV